MTSRMPLPKLTALLLAAGLVLAGCGGDDEEADSQPAPPAAGADETPGSSGGGAAGLPEVTENATDLEKEPVIAAGEGEPPTELQTEDLVVGDGTTAEASHTVQVRYTGALYADGMKFDSSWPGEPATFPLSNVVPGFAQGIEGMKVGGRRLIVIPGDLAYGANPDPRSGIPPNAALVFVVDLVETG